MDHFISRIWPNSRIRDVVEYAVMLSVLAAVIATTLRILGVMQ